jgi:hypothetical protein
LLAGIIGIVFWKIIKKKKNCNCCNMYCTMFIVLPADQ